MVDLSEFAEMDEKGASWTERSEAIHRNFPSVARLDWDKAFHIDPGFMGKLINDMIKIGGALPGRPGKRPAVPADQVHSSFRELDNQDYTVRPFPEAFKILAGSRSVRHLAANTGLDRNMIHKILTRDYTPPIKIIEQISKGLKKQPEYFAEYRARYVLGFLNAHLDENPEASMLFFRRIKSQASNGSS